MHLLLCQSPFNLTKVEGIGPLIVVILLSSFYTLYISENYLTLLFFHDIREEKQFKLMSTLQTLNFLRSVLFHLEPSCFDPFFLVHVKTIFK